MRYNIDALYEGILACNRGAIARAITLVESAKPAHREKQKQLLSRLVPHTGHAVRIGISGVPGAGKSTFIDALGTILAKETQPNKTVVGNALNNQPAHKIAILAIDPSSSKTGGSILGDRTRMGELASFDNVFIRPSPSGGHLGGVARATRQAMVVFEAAGFDVIMVETVGVGQSEIAVSEMVDTFLLLHVARTGDQLQGIKRGILELADVIAVTKADGDNAGEARVSARELSMAMKMIGSHNKGEPIPPVLTCSSVTGEGLQNVWEAVLAHRESLLESGSLDERRKTQQRMWLWNVVTEELIHQLETNPNVMALRATIEAELDNELTTAQDGAQQILTLFANELAKTTVLQPDESQ